jgi:hypothetical protein
MHTLWTQYLFEHSVPTSEAGLTWAKYQADLGLLPRFEIAPHPHSIVGIYWTVTLAGQDLPIAAKITQLQAIEAARAAIDAIGHQGSIRIKGLDGRYREEWTYPRSRDPFPPRG